MNHSEFLALVTDAFEKPVLATIPLSRAIGQFIAANNLWQQVEDRTGISRRSLQRSFNGKSKPSMDTIMQVLNLLGVNFRPVAIEVLVDLHASPTLPVTVEDPPAPALVPDDGFDLSSLSAITFVGIISEQLGIHRSEVKRSANVYDLGGDSLDMVEVIMALEDEFEIEIPDPDPVLGLDPETIKMGDLHEYVVKLVRDNESRSTRV